MVENEEINDILHEIKHKHELSGIIFSSLEGSLIAGITDEDFDKNEFVAMSATVLGSAKGLAETLNEQHMKVITSELEHHTLILMESDPKTFLLIIVDNAARTFPLTQDLKDCSDRILNAHKNFQKSIFKEKK